MATKEVYFDLYCNGCKNFGTPEGDEPCNECLANPCNEDSHKPVNFKSKEIVYEKLVK